MDSPRKHDVITHRSAGTPSVPSRYDLWILTRRMTGHLCSLMSRRARSHSQSALLEDAGLGAMSTSAPATTSAEFDLLAPPFPPLSPPIARGEWPDSERAAWADLSVAELHRLFEEMWSRDFVGEADCMAQMAPRHAERVTGNHVCYPRVCVCVCDYLPAGSFGRALFFARTGVPMWQISCGAGGRQRGASINAL